MPAAVAVPTQSPGALDMGITVADVKDGTNLDHEEIEGVELVNSMSSDAGEIKGEVNGEHYHPRPVRSLKEYIKPGKGWMSSLEGWWNLKMGIGTWPAWG